MTKPHTYSAKLKDGTIVTRNTNRIYSHVLAVLTRGTWGPYAYIGRPDLVAGNVRTMKSRLGDVPYEVIALDHPF